MELNAVEKEIDECLGKASFYLQTYRSLEAFNLLQRAEGKLAGNDIQLPVEAAVYRLMADCQIQMGKMEEGIGYLIKCFERTEDNDNEAVASGLIIAYCLQLGKNKEALEFAEKALATAKAPELLSRPYQIMGAIAGNEGDYLKAIELMTKAAELSEQAHCLTDLAMIILDMSVVFVKMDIFETALSEVYRAERYVKECRNFDLYQRCAIRRAKVLYKMGRDEEAKNLIIALDEQKIG